MGKELQIHNDPNIFGMHNPFQGQTCGISVNFVWCRETFFQAIYTSEITESGEFEVSEFEVGILKFVELDIVN